jgi:hypothetical protein
MAQLTEWLKLMVAEINRKQEEDDRGTQEELARVKEKDLPSAESPASAPVRTAQGRGR